MALNNISQLVTIGRHLAEEQAVHPEATGEFTLILADLAFAIRLIAKEVRRAGLNDILGMTDSFNYSGDRLRRLDEYANEAIIRTMSYGGHFCAMASEESTDIIRIPKKYTLGKYVLLFDPVDGSTNIDVNITIGSIFSIYERLDPSANNDGTREDVLQPGYKQLAAGYALYGSSTLFAYTTGNGVNVFTFDPTIGEFLLTKKNLIMPIWGNHYSCNEGNVLNWSERVRNYLNWIKTPSEDKTRPYYMRYIATAVGDVHRILHYGGIYLYPADEAQPDGKIRLIYEANPLSFIIEQAGGRATTGKQRILEIKPDSIHQKTPFFVGSERNITEFLRFYNGEYER